MNPNYLHFDMPSPELNFRFKSIIDLQFYLTNFRQDVSSTIDDNDINVSLWANPGADPSKKEFRLQFGVSVFYSKQDPETPIASYVSESTFVISNFDEAVIFDGKDYLLQDHHLVTLMGMALSTVRGILREKFATTSLAGFLLPAVAPKDVAAFLGIEWPIVEGATTAGSTSK